MKTLSFFVNEPSQTSPMTEKKKKKKKSDGLTEESVTGFDSFGRREELNSERRPAVVRDTV